MSTWHAQLTDLEATVVDELQSDFPIAKRPFRVIADRFDADEEAVLAATTDLVENGILRRVGPVLNPPVIGSSALAAVSVPDGQFEQASSFVNSYDEVNHNYRRDHQWNMWFVVTAHSRTRRNQIIEAIEAETGSEVLTLPMRRQYYIGLEFPVVNDDQLAWHGTELTEAEKRQISGRSLSISEMEKRILLEIQNGFELTATPYREIAKAAGEPTKTVCQAIESLSERNAIKRIGCVVNHHAVGFDENCMVVWDVPDYRLDTAGTAAGSYSAVTYCCHRPRRSAMDWPYNLFTMIHGRSAEAVEATIDELAAACLPYSHERLHTTAALKQTGTRYSELMETDDNRTELHT